MQKTLVWFRQDLRLSDHPALGAAAAKGPVLPLYILDDENSGEWRTGGAARWWLHQSLSSLQSSVPLTLRRGRSDEVLREVLIASGAQSLHFTRNYAPWSGPLEQRVKSICDELGIACHRHGGFLLHEPEAIRNGSGEPYRVYSPFSRACFASGEPRQPKPAPIVVWSKHDVPSDKLADWDLLPTKPDWAKRFGEHRQPGEASAQETLHTFLDEGLAQYADGRDFPGKKAFSMLSAHLHWGEISPHQVWAATRAAMANAAGKLDRAGEKFLKELLWREFSYHLLHHWPELPLRCFRPEFEKMPYIKDDAALQLWQQGKTGYPIVDAGMRQLWATGFVHNRVRMVVASFLIKHLQIDWREGERWFWDCLCDADIASNSASWQWVAGCGADAAPYYRIFNPIIQGAKFDPDGVYVKRWVHELRDVPTDHVHTPWEMKVPPTDYPKPMVDHAMARTRAMEALASLKGAV